MDMELEYKEGILFINLIGNLNKNTTYKIYNYLIPILEKHQIKEVIYNLDKLKSIDEDGLDSILKTKWLIDRYKGIVYLNKVNKQIFGKLKRLHIKDYLKERWKINNDNIMQSHEKMIWKIASHFYGVDKNDLYQAGVVGLLKALENYDKNSNTKFSTYAYDYIFGEMYNLASNRNIKISKDILKLYKKIEETRYILAQKLNKIPSNYELSEFLNISLDDINIACNSANVIMSLDIKEDDEKSFYETLGMEEDYDTKILIDEGMSILDEDEKNIIKSRYFEDLTQSEVAKKLNMTQVMVSRYEKKGISKMRKYLTL